MKPNTNQGTNRIPSAQLINREHTLPLPKPKTHRGNRHGVGHRGAAAVRYFTI